VLAPCREVVVQGLPAPHVLGSKIVGRAGDIPTAIAVLERSLTLAQRAHVPRFSALLTSASGAVYVLTGRVAEALPLLDQGLEHTATGSLVRFEALGLTALSEVLLCCDCVDEPSRRAACLLALSHAHIRRGYQAHAYRLFGEIAARTATPEVELGDNHYRQALALAEELGMRPLQAHCHRGLGTLYAATGQQEQARAELSMAVEMYRGMEMTFWLPETEEALVQVDA
jgi:tetratricopeptide (TPR) repeat protein